MPRTAIAFVVMLIFLAGTVCLQIFLSKKKNKWLGLIIPLICFIFSIIAVLSFPIYMNTRNTSVTEIIDGVEVTREINVSQSEKSSMFSILTFAYVFFISNIPTVIFVAIYFACREKLKLHAELDKMNIQDLE